MKNFEVQKYLFEVKRWLPCGGSLGRRILRSLAQEVKELDSPDRAALEKRFGSPRQIAAAYVEEMDTGELLAHMRLRRRMFRTVISALMVALLLWAGAVSLALHHEFVSAGGQCVRVIDETGGDAQ